ncbi:unnamed protein product [Calicophoron daubneyi]|uniref:CUB domain-containing protein n=1 Tax=Calicophoron daubneyi TaxID=300641 RepID=A0AAV2TN03_CALDB
MNVCHVFTVIPGEVLSHVVSPTLKPILGAKLPWDEESMFRLPNQSDICNCFINSFYLDNSDSEYGSQQPKFWSVPTPTHESPVAPMIQSLRTPYQRSAYVNGRGRQPLLYTFTSPQYPREYPSATDCLKIIRAPYENQRIVLKFRGAFLFEPSSECVNDYLEVRDGQYGFSPLIGRFCEDTWHLRSIVSTGRWLWLRFHTDLTIETFGFQAIYYFQTILKNETTVDSAPVDVMEKTVSVTTSALLDEKSLTAMWEAHPKSTVPFIPRPKEFIIDFRTVESNTLLQLRLTFARFPHEDKECRHNVVEIYDKFFLSDRDESGRLLPLLKQHQLNLLPSVPKVVRACNQPSLDPVIHEHGRGIVRILVAPDLQKLADSDHLSARSDAKLRFAGKSPEDVLPEITLYATVLTRVPCRSDWSPCMKLKDMKRSNMQMNTTGHSVVEVLMASSTKMNRTKNEELLTTFGLESTYCIYSSLVCNNVPDCPGGEDEVDCPRAPGTLSELIERMPDFDLSEDGDEEATTTTPAPTINPRAAEDDDFQHHPSVIIGLLGFCAICGLLSAGITLLNRTKDVKTQSLSSICNHILFDSNSSLITTIGSNSMQRLKNCQPIPTETGSLEKVDWIKDNQSKRQTDEASSIDQKCEQESEPFCPKICLSSRKPSSAEETKVDLDSLDIESPDLQQHKVNQDELTRKKMLEAFNGSAKPLGFVPKLSSSPEWNVIGSNSSHSNNPFQFPNYMAEPSSPCVRPHPSQNSTGSFGRLPNTVVYPVEKLSNVIYQSGLSSARTAWSRSGPIPLITGPDGNFSQHFIGRRFNGTHSAKCLSRRPSGNPEASELEIRPAYPVVGPGPIFSLQTRSDTSGGGAARSNFVQMQSKTIPGTSMPSFWEQHTSVKTEELKQRRPKGGPAKRPRYSFDPYDRNQNTTEIAKSKLNPSNVRQCAPPTPLPIEQHAAQWTSSCSTSGELLDEVSKYQVLRPVIKPLVDNSERLDNKRKTYWIGQRPMELGEYYEMATQKARPLSAGQLDRVEQETEDSTSDRDLDECIRRNSKFDHKRNTESMPKSYTFTHDMKTTSETRSSYKKLEHKFTVSISPVASRAKSMKDQIRRQQAEELLTSHQQQLPCNCQSRGAKFAFPSSMSVTDCRTLMQYDDRNTVRNASLEEIHVDHINQYDGSDIPSSHQNSEETETPSYSADRLEVYDTGGPCEYEDGICDTSDIGTSERSTASNESTEQDEPASRSVNCDKSVNAVFITFRRANRQTRQQRVL